MIKDEIVIIPESAKKSFLYNSVGIPEFLEALHNKDIDVLTTISKAVSNYDLKDILSLTSHFIKRMGSNGVKYDNVGNLFILSDVLNGDIVNSDIYMSKIHVPSYRIEELLSSTKEALALVEEDDSIEFVSINNITAVIVSDSYIEYLKIVPSEAVLKLLANLLIFKSKQLGHDLFNSKYVYDFLQSLYNR